MTNAPPTSNPSLPPSAMEILACPKCQAGLIWENLTHTSLTCRYCQTHFVMFDGVWQLRAEDALNNC